MIVFTVNECMYIYDHVSTNDYDNELIGDHVVYVCQFWARTPSTTSIVSCSKTRYPFISQYWVVPGPE